MGFGKGRPPEPNVIKLLKGNPGKRRINLEEDINPEVRIPDLPKWLNAEAREEWRRITRELEAIGLISHLDRSALALYCQAWGQLCQMEEAFEAQRQKALQEADQDGMVSPYMDKTPTGYVRESPKFKMLAELREQVNRYLTAFGLSPVARARIKASDVPKTGAGSKANKPPAESASLRSFA